MASMIAPSPPSAFLELQAAYAPDCPRGQVLRQHRAALCGVVAEPPRSHSPKLGFALLRPAGNAAAGAASADEGEAAEATEVQVVMNVKFAGEDDGGRYAEAWRSLGCGDLVLVEGHPGKTRTGTRAEGFSLFACSFAIQRMAPDVDRALRLLLQLPNAAPASGSGSGDLRGTAAAEAAAAAAVAEPSAAEHELRRLLSSMLHEEHPTAPVLQLLQSLAAPRLERRRRDDRLAVEGAATAAAAAAEAAEEAAELYASLELPSDDTSASNTQGALGEARMQRIRTVASRRQRGLIVVLEELDQPANVGAALRTCDGFGVATVCHVAASSTTAGPLPADGGDGGAANGAAAAPAHFDAADPVVQACSKSASVWLSHRCFESTAACAAWLREQGVPSVATTPPHDELLEWSGMQQQQQEEGQCPTLEPEPEAPSPLPPHRVRALYDDSAAAASDGEDGGALEEGALPWGGPRLAIWFGNESRGLSQAALRLVRESDEGGCMTVPMLGMVESLNIAATVAVCLTEVTRQRAVRRALLRSTAGGGDGDRKAGARGGANDVDGDHAGGEEEAGEYGFVGDELEGLVRQMAAVAKA